MNENVRRDRKLASLQAAISDYEAQFGEITAEEIVARQRADREDAVVVSDAATAIRNAHQWFEVNSGWAPPEDDELAEWLADGVCRSPDDCLVEPEGWCSHGLASWWLIMQAIDAAG